MPQPDKINIFINDILKLQLGNLRLMLFVHFQSWKNF